MALNNKKKTIEIPEEEINNNKLELVNSDSDQSQSPKSVGSSNSPLSKKHTLVDYEYDSDEEDIDENDEVNDENREPLAKRPATESRTHLKEATTANVVFVKSQLVEEGMGGEYGPSVDLQSSGTKSIGESLMAVDVVDSVELLKSNEIIVEEGEEVKVEVKDDKGEMNNEIGEGVCVEKEDVNVNGNNNISCIPETVNSINTSGDESNKSPESNQECPVITTTPKTDDHNQEPTDEMLTDQVDKSEIITTPPPTNLNQEITLNGFHRPHKNINNITSNNNNNNKYDLTESSTEMPNATSLFLNITTKIVTNGSIVPSAESGDTTSNSDENESIIVSSKNQEIVTSSASSPVSLTSLEPANKRARLSNS